MKTAASQSTAALRRPAPQPTTESQPFWDACARHELVIQQCRSCGRHWFPPSNRCQHCWSGDFAWTPVSGRGELYSFTIYHRAYAAELTEHLPYVVGIVQLDEGPRVISNVVGVEPDDVRVGMPLEVVFRDLAGGGSLHAFQPRPGPGNTNGERT